MPTTLWGTTGVPSQEASGANFNTLTEDIDILSNNIVNGSVYNIYNAINGIINNSGNLIYTSLANFKYIPISSGDTVKILGNATNISYYAFLKSAIIPVVGESNNADFATGYSSRQPIGINSTIEVTAPSDAKYLYITNYDANASGDKSMAPQNIFINEIDICTSLVSEVIGLNASCIKEIYNIIKGNEITIDYTSELNTGYINYNNGIFENFGNDTYKATKNFEPIPKYIDSISIDAVFQGNAGVAFYSDTNESNYLFASQSKNFNCSQIPSNAKYIRISNYNSNSDHSNVKITYTFGNIYQRLKDLEKYSAKEVMDDNQKTIDVTNYISRGFINYSTGKFGNFGSDAYKATNYYIPIPYYTYKIVLQCTIVSVSDAGVAFYSEENENSFISGSQKIEYTYNDIPSNANYIRFTDYNANGDHSNVKIIIYYGNAANRISSIEVKQDSMYYKKIACWGDSVTEGIGMHDQGTATYGGDTYESHLYTMLKDAGKPFIVENHGHRYERSIGIISRFKGAYLNDDIIIPANNAEVSISNTYMENGELIGESKLNSYLNPNEPVRFFVGAGYDTNPLNIMGKEYTLTTTITKNEQDYSVLNMAISKTNPDGLQTIIPKNTLVLTNSNRKADINIVYIGINDGNIITLQDWIDRNLQIQETNPNTIIIGCTRRIWGSWKNSTGTQEEKYQAYLDAAHAAFGARFIDLYADLVSEKGMQIAIDGGYLSNRTAQQIEEDATNIANKILPSSLSENGEPNNVHLNSAGYYIFAKLVYDRLLALGWI